MGVFLELIGQAVGGVLDLMVLIGGTEQHERANSLTPAL
jgi:hypothetical protein